MAEVEEEDMDRRSGILCTFFLGAGRLRFSLFCAKSKIIVFCMVQKSRKGKKQKGMGGRKTDCWARAYPGSRSHGFESGQCFFVQELVGRAGAFCVLYHGRE